MDARSLRKVTREFNFLRSPECRARTVGNDERSLTVEFTGSTCFSCCFDEHFVDYVYYIEDLTGERFEIAGIERIAPDKFRVVYVRR